MNFLQLRRLVAALALVIPSLAFAEDAAPRRVTLHDGKAVIKGSIKGYDGANYVFAAQAGDPIVIELQTKAPSTYFNLTAPGANEAAFIGSTSGMRYSGVAPVAGDYTAQVYMMRNEARRGKTARYTLTITLNQQTAHGEHQPDFADGLAGGPDYWEVTGVPKGDALMVRSTPSPKGKLVTKLLNTAVVKNKGCKMTGAQRWCQVEDGAGRSGWVNGKFLREGAPPQSY
jgi:hypothetical protein